MLNNIWAKVVPDAAPNDDGQWIGYELSDYQLECARRGWKSMTVVLGIYIPEDTHIVSYSFTEPADAE